MQVLSTIGALKRFLAFRTSNCSIEWKIRHRINESIGILSKTTKTTH
ncbi:hypothetical protein [Acinetobacter baretiae]|nr:hypothetical protein [Acinetobacter baretiae]